MNVGQHSNTPYQVCTRCVMDSDDPEISFDGNGFCNYCTEYFERAPGIVFSGEQGEKRLKAAVEKVKAAGRGKPYDSILGVSGGVDSTYVAYHARKLGLRPLAVHFDNGWNSELAVKNIENILKVLEIDLYTYVVDWDEFRDLQLAFLKASVVNSEIPTDHGFLAVLHHVAAQKGIRYFLTGSNFTTEGILPKGYGYLSVDVRQIRGIQKRFGTVPLKTYPQISLPRYFYYRFVKGLKKVALLNYLDYNANEAMEIIERELGWKYYGGKHYESIYTRFFQSYILPRKFGIDKRKAHFSTLICSGQMTRADAVEKLKSDPYPEDLMKQDREYVTKKLGLSLDEFEAIMQSPVRSHLDFPNNAPIFDLLQQLNEWRHKRARVPQVQLPDPSRLPGTEGQMPC